MRQLIHAVTDGAGLPDFVQTKLLSLVPEIDAVCIREKELSAQQLFTRLTGLIERGMPPEKLILHSSPDLVPFLPVLGVHFSEFDEQLTDFKQKYPDKLAGRSVHCISSARKAESQGADYLYFGHVFATNSKKNLPGRGLDVLHQVTQAVTIPVIAIGGIHEGNIAQVRQAGASGAAMISAFFNRKV
ncbi:thiamine phosphate synthase [Domibacillus robiginosus]|uniref:thiamine phosphate synthase n=1 Tax=Domibacillus robiginosus TaxID=1071054 RepID=UPI00067BCB69|nr:thiamine phosphate synthase [Domibacillus robiginosus]